MPFVYTYENMKRVIKHYQPLYPVVESTGRVLSTGHGGLENICIHSLYV